MVRKVSRLRERLEAGGCQLDARLPRACRPALMKIGFILVIASASLFGALPHAGADESLPGSIPDIPSVVRTYADQLTEIESDKEATSLFISTIGPALQLSDAARTLGALPLPAKVSKELLAPDLAAAALRLMGSLAAWHFASSVRQAAGDQQLRMVTEPLFGSPRTRAWLDQQEKAPWHDALQQLSGVMDILESTKRNQGNSTAVPLVPVLERATRLELVAMQAGYQEWDRIRNWKDQIRRLRGQARLCGTWQWTIHNHHQHHREQKASIQFPPAGSTQAMLPGLAEMIILGDNVYLRWEIDGRVQEDSLQFSKEGQRLEGTFINSQGGWGSISGKKTADCVP